ncbi:MAG: hypothetical protein ACYDA8_00630, partial [Deferrisomatales bacterium]
MELRLATFNFENLGLRPGEETPEARAALPGRVEALRRVVRRLDADAVAFQELVDPALLGPLLQGLGYPHLALSDRGESPLRCGVFARAPLVDAGPVAAGASIQLTDEKTGFRLAVQGPFSRPALRVRWL